MALSQTDLDNLDAAIASGELKVAVNGRMVEYRSIGELTAARAHVLGVLSGTVPTAAQPARRTGAYRYTFTTGRGD